VKGDAYEGLLEKNAQDTKGGAGQYFTPRPLIQAIVEVMRPGPADTICDPACGTGGFLLAAHEHIVKSHPSLTREEKKHLKLSALHGVEIVDAVTRLCAMNLLLHGIGPTTDEASPPVETADSLRGAGEQRYSMVLTNPPFGKKSSVMVVTEDGGENRETLTVRREDFWATTSNKQLNFVQHIKTILDVPGRAAVIVPDNVLFEGGAGETIRRKLLHDLDVHTLLRLPTGIFYAQGVKANVLFFDKKTASATPWTKKVWIYDLRTNKHFTLKTGTLTRADLDDFVDCYKPERLPALPGRAPPTDPALQLHRTHLRRNPPPRQSHRPLPRRDLLHQPGLGRPGPRLRRLARPGHDPRRLTPATRPPPIPTRPTPRTTTPTRRRPRPPNRRCHRHRVTSTPRNLNQSPRVYTGIWTPPEPT
jgi:type I restriction-modification system DNA methylase subunit